MFEENTFDLLLRACVLVHLTSCTDTQTHNPCSGMKVMELFNLSFESDCSRFCGTVPHWRSQPGVCAGWWPAAVCVCEFRPSQGQTVQSTAALCSSRLLSLAPTTWLCFSRFKSQHRPFLKTTLFSLVPLVVPLDASSQQTDSTCCSRSHFQFRSSL